MPLVGIRNVGISRSAIILTHDLLVAQASLLLAFLLVHDGRLFATDVAFLVRAAPFILVAATVAYLGFGLHRQVWSYTSIGELVPITKAATVAVVLFACIGVAPDAPILVVHWFVLVVGLCGTRVLYRSVRARGGRIAAIPVVRDFPVLLYGYGPIASFFIRAVQSTPDTSVRVIGILDASPGRCGLRLHHVPILGVLNDLDRVLAELAVQGIQPRRLLVAGGPDALLPDVRRLLERGCVRHALELQYLLPDILSLPRLAVAAKANEGAASPARLYFRVRRIVEVVVTAAALLVLAPVIAAIALAVLVDLGRPVLFRQVRPGRYMRLFTLYKFRTMRAPYAYGSVVPDYERISALGDFLRRSRLDELPQIFNVLRGDMSFIGPRPLLPRDLPDDVAERVTVRPGITGWAQVNGGHKLSPAEKMAFDRWYVRNASVMVDALILWRTVRMMVLGEEINRLELEYATAADYSRRRLLAINRYFCPDECATSQLLTDLVADLAPDHFATIVFAGRQSYVNSGATLLARQYIGNAEVRRVLHTHFGRFVLPGRAIDCITFAASAFLALVITARRGDVILAKTDPPLCFRSWGGSRRG
jgi:lipopolysaccharide/colanic/teichoic acid biosynthesis glycosyltransferase